MIEQIPVEKAVRVAFAFAIRHYPCFSLEYSDKLFKKILCCKSGSFDIHTPIGGVFAVVCQTLGIFGEQYYELAKQYFYNVGE